MFTPVEAIHGCYQSQFTGGERIVCHALRRAVFKKQPALPPVFVDELSLSVEWDFDLISHRDAAKRKCILDLSILPPDVVQMIMCYAHECQSEVISLESREPGIDNLACLIQSSNSLLRDYDCLSMSRELDRAIRTLRHVDYRHANKKSYMMLQGPRRPTEAETLTFEEEYENFCYETLPLATPTDVFM